MEMRPCAFDTGITPAHAGKRAARTSSASSPRDHPRTCGEKEKTAMLCSIALGSPPHMRGKGAISYIAHNLAGITPAHAGKSHLIHVKISPHWDHPRTCGEKESPHFVPPAPWGSPPHMRGKVTAWLSHGYYIGITPAHAGKRLCHYHTCR